MIQAASLPAIAMAAITLFVGAYHLLVWLRARRGRVDLTFAASCLFVGIYDIACAGLYSAPTVADGVPWQRTQRIVVAVAGVCFAWFVSDYTRRLPRWTVAVLSGLGGFSALALALAPQWVFSLSEPAIKHVHLPWGAEMTYHEVVVRPFGYTLEAFGLLLFLGAFVAAVRQLRHGEATRAVPLMAALTVMSAGVANDVGVAFRLVPTPYTIEYAFMALVVLMTYSLAGEVLRAQHMERALGESEARYRSLVEETDDLVLQVDAEGRICFANRAAAETFGVPRDGLIGLPALDIVHPEERGALGEALAELLRGERRTRTVETRHLTASDREIDVLWRATVTGTRDGAVHSLNAIGRDITARKRADESSFARYQRLERQQDAILRIALDETLMTGDIAGSARRLAELAAETLEVARFTVWRLTEDGTRMSCLDLYERDGRRHSVSASLSAEESTYFASIVRDRVVASEDALSDPRLAELRASYLEPAGITAAMEAPIRVAGWFVGTVRAEHVGVPREWLDDEILFAGELADQMAQAILNADRHKVEASLRASEARYRAMLDAMDDLVYICSSDYRIQYMNEAAIRRTGGDGTGRRCHEVLHGLRDPCPWCSSDLIPTDRSREQEVTSPKDGRIFHVSNTRLLNPDGSLARMAIMRDISAMRQAEAESRLLTAAVEQAAEMVLVTDTDGVIEYVNPAFAQVTGYSRAEAVGRTPNILKSGKHDTGFYDDLWGTIRTGRTWHGRFTNRKKDGTLFLEEAVISPVRDESGRLTHFVAVKRDVSAQERLEDQLRQMQKMEAIGQLAGGVAHDFNNLLTPILGYAELLQVRFPPDDPTHAALGEIRRAGEGARRLTAQLLAFGRKQMIELQVVELGGLVARTSRMLRRTIREDIEIVVKRAPSPCHVHVDSSQIEQVLMNLAVNAQDALPEGGRMVIETW